VKLGNVPPAPVGVTSVNANDGWMLVNGWPGESARAAVTPAVATIAVQAHNDAFSKATSRFCDIFGNHSKTILHMHNYCTKKLRRSEWQGRGC